MPKVIIGEIPYVFGKEMKELTVRILDNFCTAEGSETECALFVACMLDILGQIQTRKEQDAAAKEVDVFTKLCNMTFSELMDRERGKEE